MPARRSSAVAAADPTPTLSRRHEAGAPSARGLLFTLLGEFVLPGGGTAWTSAVLASFARLGIEEKTTRQALMRTAASGWLDPEKVGRRTRWRLTASAQKMLTEGADRIYSFTGAGLWISPHPDREAEAIGVLREAGVAADAHVFVARRSGLADVQVMVAAAWDLGAIEDRYEEFIEEFRGTAPADVLARQVEIVHAWRRFPSIDPVLPRELLPARWSGLKAARLFADRHQRWSGDAKQEWKRLNDPA